MVRLPRQTISGNNGQTCHDFKIKKLFKQWPHLPHFQDNKIIETVVRFPTETSIETMGYKMGCMNGNRLTVGILTKKLQ